MVNTMPAMPRRARSRAERAHDAQEDHDVDQKSDVGHHTTEQIIHGHESRDEHSADDRAVTDTAVDGSVSSQAAGSTVVS